MEVGECAQEIAHMVSVHLTTIFNIPLPVRILPISVAS